MQGIQNVSLYRKLFLSLRGELVKTLKKPNYIHWNLNIPCWSTQLNVNACSEWEQNVQRGKGQELFQLEAVTTAPKSLTGAEPSPRVQYFDRKEIQISSLFSKSPGSHAIYTACGMNAGYSSPPFSLWVVVQNFLALIEKHLTHGWGKARAICGFPRRKDIPW